MNLVFVDENISVSFRKQAHTMRATSGWNIMHGRLSGVTERARGHNHKIIRRKKKRRSQRNDCVCMSHVTVLVV